MKNLFAISAAFAAVSSALFAQNLTVAAPGFSGSKLFDSTPGFTITGMGADSAKSIYYIETDSNFSMPANARLLKRNATDGYLSATPLFDFGGSVFGSFVTIESGKVYFGESSSGAIRSMNLDGTAPLLIGSVTGNYDLAFSGGNAFVSANADTTFANPVSKVSTFNLATGAMQTVLDARPDYSGPIEFDDSGALLYGVARSSIGDIYRYSSGAVANAIATTPIELSPPANRVIDNGSNQDPHMPETRSCGRTISPRFAFMT